MRQLKVRCAHDGVEHHQHNPVRRYVADNLQSDRILRARRYVESSLALCGPGKKTIVELGCGVLDISGPFSDYHEVIGRECHEGCAQDAVKTYPKAIVSVGAIEEVLPFSCDVLVLCEILEHLEDPLKLIARWLPRARAVVISHPLNGDIQHDFSGGDHCWSYNDADHMEWFAVGGHRVIETQRFEMGSYRIIMSRSMNLISEIPA